MTAQPPYAEDLTLGVALEPAPDITIDSGMCAQYLAITGDQLRLALSTPLSAAVTGRSTRLANPALVLGLSIGQSTVATRRVIANLLYRNVALARQVYVGETIRTVVTPLEASWTRSGTDRAKVLLNMDVTSAEGEAIASYQRLALLPVRDADRLVVRDPAPAPDQAALLDFARFVPDGWSSPVAHSELGAGDAWEDPSADTVSSARELVRLTQNLAAAHRDSRAGIEGRRLVYGGHTISLAQASLSRTIPDLITVLAWRSCDHVAPVFEDDLLTFSTRVEEVVDIDGFRLVDATITAYAHRDGSEPTTVLAWRPVLLLAGRAS